VDKQAPGGEDAGAALEDIEEDRTVTVSPDGPGQEQPGSVYDRGDAVCVIGAGSSGLAAVKNLLEHGFEVDCYERETGVGGLWNLRHERSPVYASAHLVSSKPFTQFPDFPMPDHYPDYPDHRRVLAYFDHYADHFGLREHVWFGTEVVGVRATGSMAPDRWEVTVRGTGGGPSRTLKYAAVVVANGHLWYPNHVEYPGQADFTGKVIHSADYADQTVLRGQRVLVVGGGNSGSDIAVDSAQAAERTWYSTRRGYWYTPKYVLGRPADQVNDRMLNLRLPLWARRLSLRAAVRLTMGSYQRFGLPQPDHKPFASHPAVSSLLTYHLGHGDITPVPDIARFEGSRVVFSDGSTADPQLVIMATGYRPRFEFLPDDYLGGDPERPRLHLQLVNPAYPTFAVVGLIQPDSGQFSLVHWQSVLVAKLLRARATGGAAASGADAFWRRATRDLDRSFTQTKMLATGRHRLDVAHRRYLAALEQAIRTVEGS
jgi:hypothetical protein